MSLTGHEYSRQAPEADGRGNMGLSHVYRSEPSGARLIFTGDFNHDGKLDVIVGLNANPFPATLGHSVYEFLGNGDGSRLKGKKNSMNKNNSGQPTASSAAGATSLATSLTTCLSSNLMTRSAT